MAKAQRLKKEKKLRRKRNNSTLSRNELSIARPAKIIAGIDEVGRGPLAGPVVASAVIIKKRRFKSRIDDSKLLTPTQRKNALSEIKKNCYIGIGIVTHKKIDRVNILQATKLAMKKAITSLKVKPDLLIVDGNMKLGVSTQAKYIVGGDRKCLSIACASIVAKVKRDDIMEKYHKKFSQYHFDKNKGYPTKSHRQALLKYGPCIIHRNPY